MKHQLASSFCLTAALAVSACTSSSTPDTSGGPASVRNSCIDPREITNQTIVSDEEIQFKLRNGETWVNKLPHACSGLKLEGGFAWEVHGTLVCSNQQRITVNNTGVPCLLGAFSRAP
jgi:hypothetical protein